MLDRRNFVKALAATGIGTATLHRSIAASVQDAEATEVTAAMIKDAEWVSGNELTDEQREKLGREITRNLKQLTELRSIKIDHFELPAVQFATLDSQSDLATPNRDIQCTENSPPVRPENNDQLAFMPVTELSALIRHQQITSQELTEIYIERLEKYNPLLNCVVNLTSELAMEQAAQADREIAAGRYRGPLHGIPWGAKDLMSVPGYPTTWGIPQYKDRVIDDLATVAQRLNEAGAVLVAKLSLGAIAMGDQWFGGMTRNPWNPQQGSSGSSAGSASATVAGLVGFAIGTETLGSIISPSRRCGSTGLRPTFGRVPRSGCMPLSWTMDKVGPITRSVEDAALVFGAIHGADGQDPTAINKAFHWPPTVDLQKIKVGYLKTRREINERPDLIKLRDIGVELVEVEMPALPSRMLTNAIGIEGASIFEEMLNADDTEGWNAWPSIFRSAQMTSAIDYLRFMRLRRRLMFEVEEAIKEVDVLINVNDLLITNLTGHPSVVLPREILESERNGMTPRSDVFMGHLHGEETLLALTMAYQNTVDGHLKTPPLEKFRVEFEAGKLDDQQQSEKESDSKKSQSKDKGK